jgi:branched-chain amino acid transport system permease protein
MAEVLIFATLNGLVTGLLLFMLASGLTLIFSMMGVLNFAHASFYMLGAYFAFSISQQIGFWPALLLAPVLVGALGALVERYGLRHVHKSGPVAELVFTFGLAFLIEEAVQLFWGRATQDFRPPAVLDFALFTLFGQDFPAWKGFMLCISVTIFIALYFVLSRTRVGILIQAAISHPQTVANLGHNVPLLFMVAFGVGSGLAGLAGVIAGPALGTFPGMATVLGSIVFVIVVIGGLGSLTGALVASLLIGLLQSWAIASNVGMADLLALLGVSFPPDHLLRDVWRMTLPQVAPLLPYLLLVLMLIFRPAGLFGKREG